MIYDILYYKNVYDDDMCRPSMISMSQSQSHNCQKKTQIAFDCRLHCTSAEVAFELLQAKRQNAFHQHQSGTTYRSLYAAVLAVLYCTILSLYCTFSDIGNMISADD